MVVALRWLFWFASFATVLVAIATVTGRALLPWLDDLEPRINALLADGGVELQGLRGSWRGLNPIIRADSVRFDGGSARSVLFELDLVESAAHSALVARRIRVASLDLSLIRSDSGTWQLGGGPSPPRGLPVPVRELLSESDDISLPEVRVKFFAQGSVGRGETAGPGDVEAPRELLGDFQLSLATRNIGGHHAGILSAGVHGRSCDDCGIDVRYDVDDNPLGLGRRGGVAIDVRDFAVAPELGIALGAAGGVIDVLHGRLQIEGDAGWGALEAHARDISLAQGGLRDVQLRAIARADDLETWRGRLPRLRLASSRANGQVLDIENLNVAAELSETRRTVDVRIAQLDLNAAADIVRSLLGGIPAVETWLARLEPRGEAQEVQVRSNLDAGEITYGGRVAGLSVEAFKGVPKVRRADVAIVGYEHGVAIDVDEDDVVLGFHNIFDHDSEFQRAHGSVLVWFRPGYIGVRGRDLEFATGTARARGAFVIARPSDPYEQTLAIFADVRDISVPEAKRYVPNKLSPELLSWVEGALLGGQIDSLLVGYLGHLRVLPDKVMRHAEVSGRVRDASVRFATDWPVARELDGAFEVVRAGTRVSVERGRLHNAVLTDTEVFVPRDASIAEVRGVARSSADDALRLIRESPLHAWLPQVDESWTADGRLVVDMDLAVPVRGPAEGLQIDLGLELADVSLDLGAIGLELQDLNGPVRYRHPFVVTAPPMPGRMFDRPAMYRAETLDGVVRLGVTGRVAAAQVVELLEVPDQGLIDGDFDFDAGFLMSAGAAPRLEVTSDLAGAIVDLPEPFGKNAEEVRPTRVGVTFEEEFSAIEFEWSDLAQGWIHLHDGGGVAGYVRVGADDEWIPPQEADRDALMVVGRLESADLGRWFELLPLLEGGAAGGTRWSVPGFELGRAYLGGVAFDDLLIDARGADGQMTVSVDGAQVKGSLSSGGDSPMQLDVDYIAFPPGDEGEGDPLAGVDLSRLPDLDVNVNEILVGDANFGRWSMQVRRAEEGFLVHDLVADVKGLHVESTAPGRWTANGDNQTRFIGTIRAGDLAGVLPQWNYAASIESKHARLNTELSWPGSPLNFSLWHASGTMDVDITEGRFLDVQSGSGTVRIFGLFNLAALAKRMTLDFSDVFGKGISFDEVTARTELVDGFMTFVEPMLVAGTGGSFRLTGSVDLESGALANEMVVTLPVSASLPWYAAYLSVLANPIIGGAVFVGQRLFRDQIDAFSSAKYKIGGTLEDPEVTFVQVFASAMGEKDAPSEGKPQADAEEKDS